MSFFYIYIGIDHFNNPNWYVRIIPPIFPYKLGLVYFSGILEILLGFLLLIKKTGNWADKLIGYPYFIFRIPYFLILMIFKLRDKDRVIGFYLGCFDFFFNKKSE